MSIWSAQNEQIVIDDYNNGVSASTTARRLSEKTKTDVTRSAVIGKCSRLKKAGKITHLKKPSAPKKKLPPKQTKPQPVVKTRKVVPPQKTESKRAKPEPVKKPKGLAPHHIVEPLQKRDGGFYTLMTVGSEQCAGGYDDMKGSDGHIVVCGRPSIEKLGYRDCEIHHNAHRPEHVQVAARKKHIGRGGYKKSKLAYAASI